MCRQNEKSWLQLSGIKKKCCSCVLSRVTPMNCGRFISELRSLNVHHHEGRHRTNPRTVASACHQTTHQCACHSGHHRIFIESVPTYTLQSWLRTFTYTRLVTKRQSAKISWKCTIECMFQCLLRRAATSTRQEYKLLFKGIRRLLTKMVAILKIIYAFSCSVVKLCEISTSLTCKYSRPGYNDIGLCGTSSITSDILWYQQIPRI